MPQTIYRKDYQPFPFNIEYCHLSFNIFADHVIVLSQIQFAANPQYQQTNLEQQNCILDGVDLEILQIELDGVGLQASQTGVGQTNQTGYCYQENKLELLGTAGKPSFQFAAQVRINPYNNKSLEGMYQSGKILCTQNEATGFRHITFYPDRPDVMARFSTEIEADQKTYPRLLSNGNLLESSMRDGGRHYARWQDPFAKPAYLYALVAGDLDLLSDSFQTCSGRQIKLEIYTDKGKTQQAQHAMESLKQSMLWDEQNFGREYDLDLFMIVAVDSFNFGAMENKGLNIFNSSLVFATDTTATDTTYENIASTIAHEYFHNWTGNRITCRDWFQLTLKEGLTVYRDELFSEDHFGREVCRIQQVRMLRNNQYPEDRGPNRHPIRPESFIDINNFYTQTVYEKGAAVIRMMASYLGAEAFRRGMDCYFEQFDGQAVTCDDFVDALQKGGGKDLSLLRCWYEQAGTPQLYVRSEWDGKEFLLHLRQENPNAATTTSSQKFPPLAFPLPLALYHPSNGEKLLQDSVLIFEQETTLHYKISNNSAKEPKQELPAKPIPSLLLDHISPVECHYQYSNQELLLLIACDQDPFNRYEALQKYLQNILLSPPPNISKVSKAPNTTSNAPSWLATEYIEQLRNWLTSIEQSSAEISVKLEPRYLSLLLLLPSLQILSATQSPPQFQALHQRRESCAYQLAQQLETELLASYQALAQSKYERNQQAVGKRELRNTILHYLCHLEKYHGLAYEQYQTANNMTDSYAALQALAYWPGQHSQEALENFCQRWQNDFLVLCRWFALQASVPNASTLQNIERLEKHPLFQKDNPNMLRSLYAVLGRNLVVFHSPGENNNYPAYLFLAQRILQVDSFNSMMAAGLAKSFVAYKSLDSQSQTAMHQALETILQTTGISTRLYEIVSKTLNTTAGKK